MAFQFPWTNLHELNLDWFLSKFKQFTNNFLETTATAESVPYTDAPSVTVTGGELDDDTDIVDPFTFNFKIPAGQPGEQGEQGEQGVPGQDGFSPIATVTKSGGVATITITDKNGTSITTISDGTVSIDQLNTKAPAILPTVSGSIANFSDGADNLPMSELIVSITPVQSGSGDPAPDNIRPISGWTGCNVTRTGKNLFPYPYGITSGTVNNVTYQVNSDGSVSLSGTASATTWINLRTRQNPFELPVANYELSGISGSTIIFVIGDADTNTVIKGTNGSGSFTVSKGQKLFSFIQISNGTNTNGVTVYPMVRSAGSNNTFEPYNGSSLSLSWQTEAGTVYGGTIDVATGLLTVTDGYITSYNGETLPSTWISDRDVYSSGTTPTTGAQVVYALATPQTYQLTPQQLFNTLYGVNNVWSDTGDSTVTYTADTMLYIQNLTQPTEDDMTANTAIANGKFFMIGNNLYRATTTIASGSQIIPGTNATPMSLADALNLL